MTNPGQGSTGNVIAAVCSFFIPGLGQLVQGRLWRALFMVILGVIIWVVTLGWGGWIINLWACIDAAMFKPTSC